jgi:hypothetical protein
MGKIAHLSLDYHEGSVERLTIALEAPTRGDITHIIAWLEGTGATIKTERVVPTIPSRDQRNGHEL